jgi:hypothetical protein
MAYKNALGLTFMFCDDGSFVALDGANSMMLVGDRRHGTSGRVVRDPLNLPHQHSSELVRTQIPTTKDSQGKSSLLHTYSVYINTSSNPLMTQLILQIESGKGQ